MTAPGAIFRHALGSLHLVAGCVLVGVCGTFFVVTATIGLGERQYRSAVTGEAAVVRKQMTLATSTSSTSYTVTYRARPPGGRELEKTEAVAPAVWDALAEGGVVSVQYLPARANSIRIAREPRDVVLLIVASVTGPIAAVGLWLVARGARDVWWTLRVHRHGVAADATVTAVHGTNVSVNRRIQWAIDYRFADHLGREQQGTSTPMPRAHALEWTEGDRGVVRFDPDRPDVSVWIGERIED